MPHLCASECGRIAGRWTKETEPRPLCHEYMETRQRELARVANRRRYAAAPASRCGRLGSRLRHYRMSPEAFAALLESQDGKCALCRTPFILTDDIPTNVHIDHDHQCCPGTQSCGACVRGILCARCNQTVGILEGANLDDALGYLQQFGRDGG